MIEIVYTSIDTVSRNAGEAVLSRLGLDMNDGKEWKNGNIKIRRMDETIPKSDAFNHTDAELIIFLSKHVSSSGVPALTVHSTGNWGPEAKIGGTPKTLSTAAPYAMHYVLKRFSMLPLKVDKVYEATHHGPTIKAPSMFVEFGGPESVMQDKPIAAELGNIAHDCAEKLKEIKSQSLKVAIGIGSNHYPSKFTRMALEKDYAFSHILPKHSIMNDDGTDNIDMLEQAVEKSSQKPEIAFIDWKSINSQIRSKIISKLDSIGIGYERV